MKKNYFVLVFILVFSFVGFAQDKVGNGELKPAYKSSTGPTMIMQPKNFFVSKPVRDLPTITDEERAALAGRVIPKNGITTYDDLSPKRKRKADYLNSAGKSPTDVDPLRQGHTEPTHFTETRAPLVSFPVVSSGASPPDPSMAVGPNHVVTMENGQWAVYDKTGNIATGFPRALSNPLQAPGHTASAGDPVVMYDREADRWFISQFQLPGGNDFLIGVSTTPDPTGSYNVYHYDLGAGNDYPHYGIWGDSYVAAGNFTGAQKVYTFNRTKMLAGDATAEIAGFSPANLGGSGFTAPIPVHSEGAGAATGPIKIVYYQDDAFGGVTSDHIGLWNLNMDWSNIPGSTLSGKNQIPTAAFDAAIAGNPTPFANIAQPGTTQRIDAIVGAVMNMAHWYKFGTYESILLNWVVEPVNGTQISGIRWVEMRSTDGGVSWSVYQEGTFEDPTGSESVFMGCTVMDIQGNIGLGYTKSGTTTFPSLYYTGRMASDGPGSTMTVAEDLVIAGTASVTVNDRYGDYGQAVRDPQDDLTFWVTSEYSGNARSLRVYSFKLGNTFNADVGVTAILQPNTGAGLTNAETVQVTIENFGLDSQSNIPVNFSIDGTLIGTENFAGPLASGASANYTFTLTADLSTLGQTYSIQACTALATDQDVNNDCFVKSVQHLLGDDVGVVAITAPNSGSGLSATEAVTITVENFGGNSQSNIPVQYTVNGGAPVAGTVPGPIASGATGTYTFPTNADLSAFGSYNICSRTLLAGDQDASNDEFCKVVSNLSCIPTTTGGCNIDGIKRFVLGTIDADDGGNTCNTEPAGSPQGYADRTNLSTDLDRVAGLNVHLLRAQHNWAAAPAGVSQISVWVDFNDNGVFEGSEQLLSGGTFPAANALQDFNITIPTNANLGSHVLRAKSIDTSGAGDINDPCADSQFGEVQDYTVNIIDSVLLSVEDNEFNNTELEIIHTGGNIFNVQLDSDLPLGDDLRVDVHNLLGQKLISMPFTYTNGMHQYNLNLSSQASGVYLVTVSNNSSIRKTKKLIVR